MAELVDQKVEGTVDLAQGQIGYRDEGAGPPVVFLHGLMVDSGIWDEVSNDLVERGLRCVRPEWPMGSHRVAMNRSADLSPPGMAELVADLLEELGLEDVTLVLNDSGGAVAQMVAASRSERIGRLVLTNCDMLDVFPPFPYSLLPSLARLPGGMGALAAMLKLRPARMLAYGPLARKPIPDATLLRWLKPALSDPGVRDDTRKLITGAHHDQTMAAAEALKSFPKTVLFAWGEDDRFFKRELAARLAELLPASKVELIPDAKTYVMIDRPDRLAELIAEVAPVSEAQAIPR